MIINQENIEALLLDYFEHRLSAEEERLLLDALKSNTGWKVLFDEYAASPNAYLETEDDIHDTFNSQSLLKKDRDDDLIALCEGLLSPADKAALMAEMEINKPLAKDYQLYQMASLKPDPKLVFSEKEKLLKGAPVIGIYARYVAIAAMMTGVIFGLWRYNSYAPEKQYVARISQPVLNLTAESTGDETKPVATNQPAGAEPENQKSGIDALQVKASKIKTNESATGLFASDSQTGSKENVGIIPVNNKGQLRQMEKIGVSSSAILAFNGPKHQQPGSPETSPPVAVELIAPAPEENRRKILTRLADLAQAPVKNLLGKNVAVENEVIHENPTEPVYTSTFRMGPFEVYRSRSAK